MRRSVMSSSKRRTCSRDHEDIYHTLAEPLAVGRSISPDRQGKITRLLNRSGETIRDRHRGGV